MSEFDSLLNKQNAAYAPSSRPHVTPRPQVSIQSQRIVSPFEAWCRFWQLSFVKRASRSEYWWVMIINVFISAIPNMWLALIENRVVNLSFKDCWFWSGFRWGVIAIWTLVTFLPIWTLTVRRLHDINKSGWWMLISLVPLIGPLWFFILTLLPSDSMANRFGPVPNTED